MNAKHISELVNRIAEIKDSLEMAKPLYEELDELVLELHDELVEEGLGNTLKTEDGRFVELVDNFAEKNTVFRPAVVRRFEAALMSAEELDKKILAAEKKAAKSKKAA